MVERMTSSRSLFPPKAHRFGSRSFTRGNSLGCRVTNGDIGVHAPEVSEEPAEGAESKDEASRRLAEVRHSAVVVVCVVGSCSDARLLCETTDAVFEQNYDGQIITVVPQGVKLKRRWALRGSSDRTRLLISSAATPAALELDAGGILATLLKLRPTADFIALLRCGERPPRNWLASLLTAQHDFDADMVAGPVKAVFDEPPSDWILAEGIFDRFGAGSSPVDVVPATDNLLFRAETFRMLAPRVFLNAAGERGWIEFVCRVSARGFISIWANDAVVFDLVSKTRMDEESLLNCEFWKAYASARAKTVRASRASQTLWRVRALGLLMAGAVTGRMNGIAADRLLRARLIAARVKGAAAARNRGLRARPTP